MSLRTFHLVFIALSVVLAAFLGAWATSEYQSAHHAVYLVTAVAAVVLGVALAIYGTAFQRKTRTL